MHTPRFSLGSTGAERGHKSHLGVKLGGYLTPSGAWSHKIGRERMSPVFPDISCRFSESLVLVGACRQHLDEPGGGIKVQSE